MRELGRGRRTFTKWLMAVKKLEHATGVRNEAIILSNVYREKNPAYQKRDRLLLSLVTKHKSGQLTNEKETEQKLTKYKDNTMIMTF